MTAGTGVTLTEAIRKRFALSDDDWETKLSASNSITIDAPIYVAEASASEVRNGTKSNPFATIADAISAINELNASTTDYTILIKGELKSTLDGTTPVGQKIYDENNTAIKAKSITIKGASGLNESGEPQDVITGKINDSDKQARPLTIATSVPVIIENLKFTGGLADEGGGIYIGGSGKVNLANGVKVCGNTANNYGGGVYIASGAKLGIYGTAQIGNSSGSLPSSSDTPSETNGINKAGQYGGGIYCEGTLGLGKSVSSDGTFSNQAITGGVYANIASYGGGIYTQSDIQMNGNFNIKNNLGTGYGGGIYYATSGTLSCGTFEGNNSGNGGAVCIASGVTVTISGGTFTSNSATSNGGAVYCYAGSLSFSGSPSFASGTKKSNDVYIGIGTGGNGASLSVSGELSVSDPIAITPATWTRGLTVVQAGANYKDSFVLTNGDWNTKISGNNLLLDAPIYVSSSGQADASGTRSNPRKTLEQACELITDSSFDYTIYIAGTLTNVQTISSSISAASITIKGTDASAKIDLSETGPALTINVVNIPITILNLTITKGETSYHGGGIHIPNSSTEVILGDGTAANGVLITANKGNQGGGIYNAGTLKIYEGVHISNNTATLIDNIADGAGIYNTGELHMFGGKIYSNTAGNSNQGNGGGVFNAGRFNFQGGQIYENTAAGMGGGIYNAGTLTMTAGTIEKNTAIYGAGVLCAEDAAFTMESGSIRENTASIYGGALYNAGTFNIKGSAFIPYGVEGATGEGKNDVFLIDNKYITVTGGLEGTSPLATIRPISYSEGTKVLAAGSGVTLANVVKKFGLTQEGYFIDSEGNLKKGILVETAAEAAEFILNNIASGDDTVLIITGDVSADDFSTLKSAFDYIFDNKSFNERPQITLDISSSTIETIPDEAFCENRYLKKIILPDSLKTIGKKAFYDSGDLESIDLPDGLVSIGDDAFNTCSDDKFTAIEIPASVTQIGARAFRNLYYLSTVTFASGSKLETLGEEAFGALSNITSIELPSGVTQIPESLFASSDKLTSITINGTLTSIGKSAFGGLTKMETITYNGGNADQFKAIPKNGNEWRAYKLTSWSPTTYLPDSTLIICTDGTSCTAAEADHE